MSARVWTVGELIREINAALAGSFGEVWVRGELSGVKVAASGHRYFQVKDAEGQLSCAMWAARADRLRFKLADGLAVLLRGTLEVYPQRGSLQLIVSEVTPQGIGELQLAFEQLKAKLEAEGLFAPERKRPLPALPQRIGLVTSASGAAVRDVLKVLSRWEHLSVLLVPGAGAGQGSGGRGRPGGALSRALLPRRRRAGRARRRLARGPLGVQRGDGGARDRRVRGAGDQRGGPRGGLHDRRLRRGRAGRDADPGRGDDRVAARGPAAAGGRGPAEPGRPRSAASSSTRACGCAGSRARAGWHACRCASGSWTSACAAWRRCRSCCAHSWRGAVTAARGRDRPACTAGRCGSGRRGAGSW